MTGEHVDANDAVCSETKLSRSTCNNGPAVISRHSFRDAWMPLELFGHNQGGDPGMIVGGVGLT